MLVPLRYIDTSINLEAGIVKVVADIPCSVNPDAALKVIVLEFEPSEFVNNSWCTVFSSSAVGFIVQVVFALFETLEIELSPEQVHVKLLLVSVGTFLSILP